MPFNSICDALKTHPAVLHFGYGFIKERQTHSDTNFSIVLWGVHLTLLLLTTAKYNLTVMGIPIAKLVTRDGIWVVGIMSGTCYQVSISVLL